VSWGGSVSVTVTMKLQLFVLPDVSATVQTTFVVPVAKLEPLAGTQLVLATPQLSPTVTLNATFDAHWPSAAGAVISPGQMIVGNSVSVTVTVKLQLLVLPDESHTVQVTFVVPLGKLKPLAGAQTVLVTAQLSPVTGLNVTFDVHWPSAAGTVMSAGQRIVGGSESLTVTVKLQLFVLPDVSATVQTTFVVPVAKLEPLAGTQLVLATPQLSPTVTLNATFDAHWPSAAGTVISDGQVMLGGWVSLMVTVKVPDAVLLAASVAVQLTVVCPFKNVVPLAGAHVTVVPGQLSLAVAVNVTLLLKH